MKNLCALFLLLISCSLSYGQFVVTMQVNEPIEGICDIEEVYSLFPMMDGQEEATCPVSKEEILRRLNSEVNYLKDKPKYKDEGMIGLIINCKGELVMCKMDNETKSSELDKQIEEVFNSLGDWKAGKLNGKKVDSSRLYSFKIKKGQFTFN